MQIAITGIGIITACGRGLKPHSGFITCSSGLGSANTFKNLADFPGAIPEAFQHLPAAWIANRALLNSRKFGPATCLSLAVTSDALKDSGLSAAQISKAHLWVGTSRGNAAAVVDPWPARRPTKLLAASNSLHGEIAAAITIEHRIRGPYHVLANGCSASLDALGMAYQAIASGQTETAIAVGVELPISPTLLRNYADAGMLTSNGVATPYHPDLTGFIPAEAGVALVLQRLPTTDTSGLPTLLRYAANSDAASLLGVPADGSPLAELLSEHSPRPDLICSHASGTLLNAQSEIRALTMSYPDCPPLIALKPYLGHSIGASGLAELAVILAHHRYQQPIPTLAPTCISMESPQLSPAAHSVERPLSLTKIASSMGGHNAIIHLQLD